MSRRFAMPNSPAKLGKSRLASGMPTGERAGRVNTPQPYMPARRKNAVAARKPANRESRPSFPRVIRCNQVGQSRRVVSVANNKNEMVSNTKGRTERRSSYQPSSGPKAIRARTMSGKERKSPSCEPRADQATPRAALPESSMRWPGRSDRAVSPSGAPISADGM